MAWTDVEALFQRVANGEFTDAQIDDLERQGRDQGLPNLGAAYLKIGRLQNQLKRQDSGKFANMAVRQRANLPIQRQIEELKNSIKPGWGKAWEDHNNANTMFDKVVKPGLTLGVTGAAALALPVLAAKALPTLGLSAAQVAAAKTAAVGAATVYAVTRDKLPSVPNRSGDVVAESRTAAQGTVETAKDVLNYSTAAAGSSTKIEIAKSGARIKDLVKSDTRQIFSEGEV